MPIQNGFTYLVLKGFGSAPKGTKQYGKAQEEYSAKVDLMHQEERGREKSRIEERAKELAKSQYDRGCDVIFQAAGNSGMGVFDALYEGHRQLLGRQFESIVTEIDDRNRRSLAAHYRVGFKTIYRYIEAETAKDWHVVALQF